MNIWIVVTILSAFAWSGIRLSRRDNSFANFARFIGEFIAFPIIVLWEEWNG